MNGHQSALMIFCTKGSVFMAPRREPKIAFNKQWHASVVLKAQASVTPSNVAHVGFDEKPEKPSENHLPYYSLYLTWILNFNFHRTPRTWRYTGKNVIIRYILDYIHYLLMKRTKKYLEVFARVCFLKKNILKILKLWPCILDFL